MIKLFNYFFPMPKTMLELAEQKILSQTHVLNTSDYLNVRDDQFFVVGTLKPRKASRVFKGFNVLFNYDNSLAVIKQDDEVIYVFNRLEEILAIRASIATVYNRSSDE